jgi:hypothetical protein
MHSATLKTIRESLGLSIEWFAEQARVQEHEVRDWESARDQVPEDVAEFILILEATAQQAIDRGLSAFDALIQEHGKPPEPLILVRYRSDVDLWRYRPDMKGLPTGFHGAILARTRRVLSDKYHINAEMAWLDADAYQTWLKATNQKDSNLMRAQFCSI